MAQEVSCVHYWWHSYGKKDSAGYLFYGFLFSECYKYQPSSLLNIPWEKYSYYHHFIVSETK